MKRALHLALCFFLLAAALPSAASEVLDGVVASVNRHPILRSDWDEAVRFEALMQLKPLNHVTGFDRTLALQHLIDRQLLTAQMGDASYMQPSDEALREDIAKLRAQVPNGNDDAQWQKLLSTYELTEDAVKQHLRTEFQVMNFVEVRLRPNVRISADDIGSYYNHQLIPDLEKNGGRPIPLDQVDSSIRELLTQQRIDELLDAWLHNLRQQADIHSAIAIPGINAPERGAPAAGSD